MNFHICSYTYTMVTKKHMHSFTDKGSGKKLEIKLDHISFYIIHSHIVLFC